MAGQGKRAGSGGGPGNRAIAALVLEWLAVRGRTAAHERAARAVSESGQALASAPIWLPDGTLDALFAAAEVEPGLARAIGHRLVAPEATGLSLYGLGLATPEKAYRRVQALLPRETRDAVWTVETIDDRKAHLRYAPAEAGSDAGARTAESFCALRLGMLEAIPGLYGLLPARVTSTTCVAHGDDACRYVIHWQADARTGLRVGASVGLAVAIVLAGSGFLAGGGAAFVAAALGAGALAPLGGLVLDLRRQLDAVAGARRGHLALFDQVDDALANKLDALARAEAKLDAEPEASPVRRSGGSEDVAEAASVEQARAIRVAAEQIFAAAGDLECFFESHAERASLGHGISEERGLVRDIREWAARIAERSTAPGEVLRSRVDLARLVERAVAAARPSLPPTAVIGIDATPGLGGIDCEPVQIEHVVVQLVRNAVEASVELSEAPEVVVRLREAPRGVELAVEDRGVGIASTEVDEVFDPFFADRPAGAGQGLGLTVCLRIIERHGGELRIENQGRAGTRVTVLLPRERDGEGEST